MIIYETSKSDRDILNVEEAKDTMDRVKWWSHV